jgi:hypothetical protein
MDLAEKRREDSGRIGATSGDSCPTWDYSVSLIS